MANIYDTTANLTMRRSVMDATIKKKMSIPFGKLVPIGAPVPVLPKDTFKASIAGIIRMLTPKAPIMDDISGDIYAFFVPWRIIWSKTKQFFGENDQVAWTLPQDVYIPHFSLKFTLPSADTSRNPTTTPSAYVLGNSSGTPYKYYMPSLSGTLLDYFSLPFVYVSAGQKSALEGDLDASNNMVFDFNALPFRGYQLIWNEFFRKSAIVDPSLYFNYDGNDDSASYTYAQVGAKTLFAVKSVARWNDLFSSCLPSPQRGPSVEMPLLGTAPIITGNIHSMNGTIAFGFSENTTPNSKKFLGLQTYSSGDTGTLRGYTSTDSSEGANVLVDGPQITKTNMYADLSSVTAASINDLRIAVATQRYYEALAHANRYTDYISVMFGGHPSDAVLQRPQYLGGCHFSINMAQVLSTTETESMPVGSTGAVSVTGIKENLYHNSFDEFGYVFHFVVLRKEHTYCQGLDKEWTKRDIWDIYNPKFAHIGEVPVMRNEVYYDGPSDHNVLGFNEPWYEYRSISASCSGLLNPLHPNSLSYFTLTDVLSSAPSLNEAFVSEDANGLDNALVASASVTDQFIADFRIPIKMNRVMPTHPVPGLMDHF